MTGVFMASFYAAKISLLRIKFLLIIKNNNISL